MSISKAYNSWAGSYDEMLNKTRDLEEKVARQTLDGYYKTIVELGCGTGKNTGWLLEKCDSLIALDFSEEMLAKAGEKTNSSKVGFRQQDLTKDWGLPEVSTNLISCSLVLEHIEDLDAIFAKSSKILKKDGFFYISELHPFKQYSGSKARFDTGKGIQELETYVHHITDYTEAAFTNGFKLVQLNEWFDEDDKKNIPRLVSFVFKKTS
ncbi:methyltransferase family protein [Gillisia sp. Hel_I_86]|uniref:class I SAM-dependent DNA methyltransferase n=1 Tax=Gillisia sp. Hel_I_86 TaxID=1249981 RepID=UPI00119A3F0A|nr:class I SAM-dependent methyltransferase [Gillisia sp. Hel_I_86]TVZ27694.1 methyltransferase family protein [Gillisia sp. Hel_I_86]